MIFQQERCLRPERSEYFHACVVNNFILFTQMSVQNGVFLTTHVMTVAGEKSIFFPRGEKSFLPDNCHVIDE